MKKTSKSIIRMLGAFLMVCALVGCADYESNKDKEQNSKKYPRLLLLPKQQQLHHSQKKLSTAKILQ